MPKQLYIPLPCAEARRQLILRQLGPGAKVAADLSGTDLDKVRAHHVHVQVTPGNCLSLPCCALYPCWLLRIGVRRAM
jgi:hypothetical protein